MRRAGPLGVAAWAAALAAAPGPAAAHLVGVEFGDFYAGALHLLSSVGYGAALLAIVLCAALQPRDIGRWALVVTPPALLLGAVVGAFSGIDVTPLPIALAALTAALAASGLRAPLGVFGLCVAATAFAQGLDNGVAAFQAPVDWRLYAAGVALAGGVAVALATAVGHVATSGRPLARLVARVVGSWIAALGLIIGAVAFT